MTKTGIKRKRISGRSLEARKRKGTDAFPEEDGKTVQRNEQSSKEKMKDDGYGEMAMAGLAGWLAQLISG